MKNVEKRMMEVFGEPGSGLTAKNAENAEGETTMDTNGCD
jgi:hypothetical protein